jgi:hypothetical protein
MTKSKRGSKGQRRGPKSQAKRDKRWADRLDPTKLKAAQLKKPVGMYYCISHISLGLIGTSKIVIHRIKSFPMEFVGGKPCGATVRRAYRTTAAELETLPLHGKILLPLDHLKPDTMPPDTPPYLIIRLEHLVTADQQHGLWHQWDRLLAANPQHQLKPDPNRSTSQAYHFGVWEVTGNTPRLTSDTAKQTPEAVAAIDNLLRFIQTYIALKIAGIYKEHAPSHWEALLR